MADRCLSRLPISLTVQPLWKCFSENLSGSKSVLCRTGSYAFPPTDLIRSPGPYLRLLPSPCLFPTPSFLLTHIASTPSSPSFPNIFRNGRHFLKIDQKPSYFCFLVRDVAPAGCFSLSMFSSHPHVCVRVRVKVLRPPPQARGETPSSVAFQDL